MEVCCVFNYAPHYRTEIYLLMEKELMCDFYFGAETGSRIRKMDYSLFKNVPKELKYHKLIYHFNWLSGAIGLTFKPYKRYIITGEPFCLSTWGLLLLNYIQGKKSYFWTHGWYGDETRAKRFVKRIFFSISDGIFLYGNYARDLMIKEGFKKKKLFVIYNSLKYSVQLAQRSTLTKSRVFKSRFRNSLPVVTFIGRVEPKKKLDMILYALTHSLKTYNVGFNICLIGDGSDQDNLQMLASKLGVEKYLWFYGASYDEQLLANLIYNSDVCIAPGEVGLMAIHSLTFGTPVISHNHFVSQGPEFEAISDGVTGTFFEKGNIEDLSKTLSKWLTEHSPKTEKLAEQCYRIIDEKYNPNYQIELLRKVIGE